MHELITRDMDWIDGAPLRVERSRDIAAAADTVFGFLADHEGWTAWFPQVQKVEVTGEPTGVGGQRRVSVGFGKRPFLLADEVFVGWEDGRLFSFTITHTNKKAVTSMVERMVVEPQESGDGTASSRITYTMAFELRSRLRWMAPIMRRQMGSNLAKALDRLADLAEGEARRSH